ncbi:MAG: ABC transporter substrate-binding protein, partial [Treponemataceae bacterium]|nr:ABC transporter substrate-binding protein [Treponemataceae bacterium]
MKKVLFALAATLAGLVMAGCSKSGGNTIKIGSIGPLSGAVAVYGVECKNGIDLAVAEINAAGGVNGQLLEVIAEDDEGNPEKSVSAYKKLVTKDGVTFVIGSLTSGCTQAITQSAQAQKIIQIAPAATAMAITDAGNYIFRTCFIDPFQGTVGGKFAGDVLGANTAAVLYDIGNDYSVGLKDNFIVEFERLGGRVIAQESYNTGDKDFNAQITKIKNVNADVIYLPDYYGTVALIAKQLRAQGIDKPIVGADGWDGLTENAGEEVLNGYYSNHYATDSDSEAVQRFVAAFEEKFGKKPNSFAALGYDSVYLLKDAILNAGTTETAAVRDALEATNGDYVTGHLTFDEKRNPI